MAPISPRERELAHRNLDSFIDASSTLRSDIDGLFKYMDYRPQTAEIQSPLPVDEMEERYQIARQIQRDNDDVQLTALQLSIIMTIPLGKLRSIMTATTGILESPIPFRDINRFVRICKLNPPLLELNKPY